jgi:hypothetical protein
MDLSERDFGLRIGDCGVLIANADRRLLFASKSARITLPPSK